MLANSNIQRNTISTQQHQRPSVPNLHTPLQRPSEKHVKKHIYDTEMQKNTHN